jgi:RNA polymerase sigma-70 factor, ECF subfamily
LNWVVVWVAVPWKDSGARTEPQEIGPTAGIVVRKDEDAARRIYRKYHKELFRLGVHVRRDHGLAEEMLRETFMKFCRQAKNYDPGRGPVRGWLFTMARSVAYDIARRPSSRPLLPVEDFQLPVQYCSVDQALTALSVDAALDKLPEIYADVMRLIRDGLTHSEIAERLGIPIGTVKSRTAKAASTLRTELASLRGVADAY